MSRNNNFKEIETRWYKEWLNSSSFVSDPNSSKESYSIMMPPPNVTGSLHIGHALTFTLQDILIRFHRMNEMNVLWQPGTDHAGIATQMVVERMLATKNIFRRDIGREKFVKEVWDWKKISGNKITDQLKALGSSPDWSRERFTMDKGLSEAVIKVFVDLYNDNLIYKDKRLVNWDTVLLTAISDLEVEQRELKSFFWYIKYPIENSTKFLIVATTRPETMLGDVAVAVNPDDPRYKNLIDKNVILPIINKKIPIIADDYSDPEKGSGVVKITPGHDFNDFEIGKKHNLEMINILNPDGTINKNGSRAFEGMDRFEARKKILQILKDLNLIDKIENIINVVPHGDRSGSIIEPWLMDQWYVNAKVLADPVIKSVKTGETKFVPKSWDKTFFEWMNNIQPWCISRQLWWGHRIPAWYGPDKKVFVDINEEGANQQAKKYYKKEVQLVQDEDVLDTWFSSALWPFSTLGWPNKTKELEKYYPTNVLVTGFDIIFFWVARMMMMGKYFMNDVTPFKEVYIHALVRDEKGQKMSKSKGNVMDPLDIIDNYGADALRFTLSSMATQGRDIKLSEERIAGYRNFSTKLVNACNFLDLNKCYDVRGLNLKEIKLPINIWLLNLENSLNQNIKTTIKEYKFNDYSDLIYRFIWRDFCDWYIEFMKCIFSLGSDADKKETRFVAQKVMNNILKYLHPLMPFVTEECNKNFFKSSNLLIKSKWPEAHIIKKNEVTLIPLIIDIISSMRSFRVDKNISFKTKIISKIICSNKAKINELKYYKNLIEFLGKIEKLDIVEKEDFPEDYVIYSVEDLLIGIKNISVNNKENEKKHLKIQLNNLNIEITKIDQMLSNKSFLKKAPKDVVSKTKSTKTKLLNKINEIEKFLSENLM